MGEEESKLVKALKGFKEKMCQKYDIKEMILFGSQVSGEADENSDVDLIVVGDEFKYKSPLKRPAALYLDWTMDYPVDFLCYTPEEFEEKRKEVSIVRQAIKEGVVI
ncbi:MAG: nucleotidyltransferase domain-containing protein [Methanomicrobia archaeon]|nr:nucleotidyltransferase domain-containing protein [Methanomicrobia archaeon]